MPDTPLDIDRVTFGAIEVRDGVRPATIGINERIRAVSASRTVGTTSAVEPIIAIPAFQGIGIRHPPKIVSAKFEPRTQLTPKKVSVPTNATSPDAVP